MKSKEKLVLTLFFNHPTKHWRFKELKEKTKLADSKLSSWLKKFQENQLIIRIKKKEKLPYYVGNHEHPKYQSKKRIFGLQTLQENGLLEHLSSLKDANTIILFGSFSRWDWTNESDIDIFINGNADDFKKSKFEKILGREIQLFVMNNKETLEKFGSGLLRNIIKGDLILGDIPKEMIAYAGR